MTATGMGLRNDPLFRIRLWGPFRIEKRVGEEYEPVKTAEWGGSNYPRLLLKALLCCPGRRGRREGLVDMLWPDIESEQATVYVNTATTKLRQLLRQDKNHESLLVTEHDATIYHLPDQGMLWVDSDAVQYALEQAERLGRDSVEVLPVLEEAIGLSNRGTFLEGEESRWAAEKRATRERERYRGRIWLVESYVQQGRAGQAETILTTLLDDDPFDEDVLCRLLVLLQSQGLTHQALLLFRRIKAFFAQEQMEMSETTLKLAAQMKQERFIPAAEPVHRLKMEQMQGADLVWGDGIQNGDDPSSRYLSQMIPKSGLASNHVELQTPLQTILVELDAVADKLSHEQYQLSRKQILLALAASPLVMLTRDISSPSRYAGDLFLSQCAASLVACNHLIKSQDFWYVKHILTHLIPSLVQIIQYSSLQRENVAHLLTQCYLLLGILESHQLNWSAYQSLNEQAVSMSLGTLDTNLQTIAHVQLAMAFFQFEHPSQALSLYQKIEPQVFKGSPLVQSDFYIKQALAYAQAGQATEMYQCVDRAYASFPAQPENDPSALLTDFGAPSLLSWHATAEFKLAQQHLEKFDTVWATLSQVDHLPPQSSAKVLVYAQTLRAETALALNDMEMFLHFLTSSIAGAKRLKSARRFRETVDCYRQARERWPKEARLLPLADMLLADKDQAKDTLV